MSIMRCERCEVNVDTDYDHMGDEDGRYCEDCYHEMLDEVDEMIEAGTKNR